MPCGFLASSPHFRATHSKQVGKVQAPFSTVAFGNCLGLFGPALMALSFTKDKECPVGRCSPSSSSSDPTWFTPFVLWMQFCSQYPL